MINRLNRLKISIMNKPILVIFIFISCGKDEDHAISLSPLFSDGMVMQRDTLVPIWGKCNPNQLVTFNSSWGSAETIHSNDNGDWSVSVPTTREPGPHSFTITSGKGIKKINDILFGEVWLAAGQSNMEMDFDYCCNTTDNASQELASANYPLIRMFNVKKALEFEPTREVEGQWIKAVGKDITSFSAVGYFFAKSLYEKLGVPVGLIHSSWGGSNLEAWTSHDVLKMVNEYENDLRSLPNEINENKKAREWFSNHVSRVLPSSGWDLYLDNYIKKKDPGIDYLSYFLDDWKELDDMGRKRINNPSDGHWLPIPNGRTVDETFGTTDFIGVVLFKNQFKVQDPDDGYMIDIKLGDDIPWGMWEYDVYINSKKVASSLMDVNKDDYTFTKPDRTVEIDPSYLIEGINQLMLRIIGYPSVGNISLSTSDGILINLERPWECSLIAEEWYQIEDYKYPYTSLYFYDKEVDLSSQPEKTIISHHSKGVLFNGMINPLIPYSIKGVIWYQGESNIGNGGPEFKIYKNLMPMMIYDLRRRWDIDLPFYFAQIAPYFNYGGMLPYFRDAQTGLLSIQNTGMVVTMDIGETYDIHPSNKHDVGERFARLILSDQYGIDIVSSGPLYKSTRMAGDRVLVEFEHVGSGLLLVDSKWSEFEIAGEDTIYFGANVQNKGGYLEVYSDAVKNPRYLRYAYSDTSSATLFNLEGLPASSFSTIIKN